LAQGLGLKSFGFWPKKLSGKVAFPATDCGDWLSNREPGFGWIS
jgi:hypothetical protein